MRRESFDQSSEPFLERLFKRFRYAKVMRHIPAASIVVDLGCGYKGEFLRRLSDRIDQGIGFDIYVSNSKPGPNVMLQAIRLDDGLPLPDAFANVVTGLAFIEHIIRPDALYRECFRILRPGGLLLLTTPARKAKSLLEFMAFRLKIMSHEEIADHKRYYDRESLIQDLIQVGFRRENITISNFELGFNLFVIATK